MLNEQHQFRVDTLFLLVCCSVSLSEALLVASIISSESLVTIALEEKLLFGMLL
jgi:hypothetical protein